MENFGFSDATLNRFYKSVRSFLQIELKLFFDLEVDDYDPKEYISNFDEVFSLDCGLEYVSFFRKVQRRSTYCHSNLILADSNPGKFGEALWLISLEITYRFGALLKNQLAYCSYFSNIEPLSKCDLVAKLVAVRIACYVFKTGNYLLVVLKM